MNVKHKHYDLIVAWANDPSITFQCRFQDSGLSWRDLEDGKIPSWLPEMEYRIKPKEPIVRYLHTYIDKEGSLSLCRSDTPWDQDCIKMSFDRESGNLLSIELI